MTGIGDVAESDVRTTQTTDAPFEGTLDDLPLPEGWDADYFVSFPWSIFDFG